MPPISLARHRAEFQTVLPPEATQTCIVVSCRIQCFAIEIRQTLRFSRWFAGLRDSGAKRRIQARIDRLEIGNPGDAKAVGGGVSELRVDYGPGYRVYFVRRGTALVILLGGGDKRTQQHDIAQAISTARDL
jgi:putative addiction module killer protein